MRKRGYISFAGLAATLILTGCFHNVHEFSASMFGGPVGYVTTSLLWEQGEDMRSSVDDIKVSVGGQKVSLSKRYDGVENLSEELLQLPVGEYDVLVTVNMSEADGFILNGLPATKADVSEPLLADVSVSLKDPSSQPAQAWYGLSHVSVTENSISRTEAELQRLLSVLTLNLDKVPAGTKVAISISNVAQSVTLTAVDGMGRYGVPGSGATDVVQLGTLTATAYGALGVKEFTMLPTAAQCERCLLTINVTTPAGQELTYIGDAPRTECGKSYTLNLDYSTLKPYMYVASSDISEWDEGWSVTGEILNPNE